jgi:hypothetical protein
MGMGVGTYEAAESRHRSTRTLGANNGGSNSPVFVSRSGDAPCPTTCQGACWFVALVLPQGQGHGHVFPFYLGVSRA